MAVWINFTKFPKSDNKKTEIWEITDKNHTVILGYIKWHAAWRKYCFFPEGKTVWDNKCLQEVQEFVDEKMREHKNK